MLNPPLEFSFSLEHGMSESDIQTLWEETLYAQKAMDSFLAGEFTEEEMTDILSSCHIDLGETEKTLENNLIFLGVL